TAARAAHTAQRAAVTVGRAARALPRLPGVSVVTPLGWTVLLGSLCAWVLGARLGWIELILAAATGLLTFALCGLFAIGRTALRITLDPAPRRLTAGETAKVTVA